MEYKSSGIVVPVNDFSLDVVVFGVGFEVGNFFVARGRGVGISDDGVIDNSGNRFSCSLGLNAGVAKDTGLACVIAELPVLPRTEVSVVVGWGEGVGGREDVVDVSVRFRGVGVLIRAGKLGGGES